jgi:hypothetical protein
MAGKKPARKASKNAEPKRLPLKREKFVENYITNGGNGKKAAEDAGFAPGHCAETEAWRLLRNADIRERIRARIDESQIDTREVIGTLVSHMRGDLAEVVPNDEFLKEAKRNGVSHLIKELEITKRQVIGANEDDPGAIETKYKIKIHDSQSAAKHLTTVFGLEKAKETHPNDVERNKREEVRKYLFEQGLLTSDTVQ